MPTYDYQCENGHHFEIFQKMTDPKLDSCPQCGGRVERLIGPGAGLVFKGSGFYSTDYRSDKYKRAAKSEPGGGGGTAAGTPETKGAPAAGDAADTKAKGKTESPKPAAAKDGPGGGSAAKE